MPIPVMVDPDKFKRVLERFILDADFHINTNFKHHAENQTNPDMRKEYVLDTLAVAQLYQDLGLGNVYGAAQSRRTGLQAALAGTGAATALDTKPPSESDLMGLLNPAKAGQTASQMATTASTPSPLKRFDELDGSFNPKPKPPPPANAAALDEIRTHMAHNAALVTPPAATARIEVAPPHAPRGGPIETPPPPPSGGATETSPPAPVVVVQVMPAPAPAAVPAPQPHAASGREPAWYEMDLDT